MRHHRQLADNTLFLPILFLTIPDLLDAAGDAKLKANREKLIGMTTAQMRERRRPRCEALAGYVRMIDEQLAGKDFFLGKSFTMADASLYHPLFFLALNPGELCDGERFQKRHAMVREDARSQARRFSRRRISRWRAN